MEKKFNEEAYRNGSEVVCDVCGSVIEHINVKTRVIARQAEGFNVTEQYFTCQECGKPFRAISNRAKYCPVCAAKAHRQQKAASERRRRASRDSPPEKGDDHGLLEAEKP